MRIGLDIGGTKIDAVLLDERGAVVSTTRRATGFGAEAVVANAQGAVRDVASAAGLTGTLPSIGIGVPGVVDATHGIVRHAVNLGVDELALGPELEARLHAPVSVENDVNAAALGAYHYASRVGSMAYLNLGTGVAAGYVVDGTLWRGARGTAGEIGHLPIVLGGELCPCGQRGCLETVASGGAIARRWVTDAELPVQEVFDQADAGNPLACGLRDGLVTGAAAAVGILVLTVDVDRVVIGGGLARLGDRLLEPVRRRLGEQGRDSSFLGSLGLADRVSMAPMSQPVAAVGAALAGQNPLAGRAPVIA